MNKINRTEQLFTIEIFNKSLRLCVSALIILFYIYCVQGQSTNQNYPTAVTSNEISGKIAPRDIGDARLTTFYYVFNGIQGDIFINVVTKNLDGDIDIFTANSLKPLTKIKIYSDSPDGETGRIVYLRQPERLILRIEGRTPNDEAATYQIKFAGSFSPIAGVAETEEPKLPEIKTDTQTDVQVNSVGTIIAVKPKPTPSPKDEAVKTDDELAAENKKAERKVEDVEKNETDKKREAPDENEIADKKPIEVERAKSENEKKTELKEADSPVVVVTDILPKNDKAETKTDAVQKDTRQNASVNKNEAKPKKKTSTKESAAPDPLAGINLVVLFKDGTKIERSMTEILRVNVDKGVLTIIHKDGSIGRYSILDVAEMTIK
jgi:hypothetical protein